MRKKSFYNSIVHAYPDRIFVSGLDPATFRAWIDDLRGQKALVLELGMGTGDFLNAQAKNHPGRFFLGVDIKEERVYKAWKKHQEQNIENIAFLQTALRSLPDYELPPIEMLYLLFPDPWPKKRHSKRRLTAASFLAMYRSLLKKEGSLILKTDHLELFEFSLEQFAHGEWRILEEERGYQTPDPEQTAYEKQFLADGKPIYYCRVRSPF